MRVQFLASVAVIAANPPESRKLYVDVLGLPLEARGADADGYYASEKVAGSNHFGVWPLSQAAEACFGAPEWPPELRVPQVSLEFEVEDVDAVAGAAEEMEEHGLTLLHPVREEPWGQTVVRLLSPEGSIVGISYTPPFHE